MRAISRLPQTGNPSTGIFNWVCVRFRGGLLWFLGAGGLSIQLGRYVVPGYILGWPAPDSPRAPTKGPGPVNWPEKCTVKAPRPQWGSSTRSVLPQPGSCLMREWWEGSELYGEPGWNWVHWLLLRDIPQPPAAPGMDDSGGAGARRVRSRMSEPMDTAVHGSVNISEGRRTRWGKQEKVFQEEVFKSHNRRSD